MAITIMTTDASCIPRPSTPTRQIRTVTGSPSPRKSPRPSPSPRGKSPRNPVNTAWMESQQRRIFLDHLRRWAANHDSSPYFHGKISLVVQTDKNESVDLEKSVKCVLTNNAWTDARKQIVIRLFPPRGRDARYKMVIRCGAGWMSARDFLSKEYFTLQRAQQKKDKYHSSTGLFFGRLDNSLQWRSEVLGPKPTDKDSVTIRPLFLPFLRLPLELQQMIIGTAAGLSDVYRPCRDRTADNPPHHITRKYYPKQSAGITLSTMLRISHSLNDHLIPWVFHTTDFRFELTGFTNFLWTCGPLKRAQIRRLSFRFGSGASLHCLRWLAPDPVFELFSPTVYTNPHALQFLWRCQIQELAREVHLAVLTLDIYQTPAADIPIIVRILRLAFGSIGHIRFKDGEGDVRYDDRRLVGLKGEMSWREMCRGWFERNKRTPNTMSEERRAKSVEDLERDMDERKGFFDSIEHDV